MNSKSGLFLFLFCLLITGSALAQEEPHLAGFGVEASLLAGKVIKHTPKFTAPIPALSTALDVNCVWQTYGKKDWHRGRNFPLVGVGITYTDYGNNAVFGKCLGIYPNIQVPLIRGEKLEWTLRLGDGVGYVTRKYQTTAPIDTVNDAIGTHINDFAVVMMDLRYTIDKHWQLQLGGNFTHISNGDYHQPNLGVNMVGTHVGVRYFPTTSKPKPIVNELPTRLKSRWLLQMQANISYKEARAKDSPMLASYMGSVYASRRWLGKNKFYAGVDYAFHNDVLAFMRYYDVHHGHQRPESWDGAVFFGNEFLVGRIGFITQIGVYYHQTFLKFDPIYEKLGGNFYIIKQEHGPVKELFISAMLLTHAIVAELSEFGVGIGI